MGFWMMAALWVASMAIGYLLRPKPAAPKPERFQPPTAEEGAPIPVIFGTWKVPPNVAWWGDLQVAKVVRDVTFAPDQFLGYRYVAGMQLLLCHGPVDELVDVQFDQYSLAGTAKVRYDLGAFGLVLEQDEPVLDPPLPLAYAAAGTSLQVDARNLYGGRNREGGVWGTFKMYFGSASQGQDAYLQAQIGATRVSAWRGLCYAVLERVTLGMTPYPKPMWFVLRRWPSLLGDAVRAKIGGDANPAEVIFEVATHTVWGCRVAPSKVDVSSFEAAATTLKAEGLGISAELRGQAKGREFIAEVLRHVDGVLYTHPTSALLTLKLIREDYDLAELPRLNPETARDLDFTPGTWPETANEIKARYAARIESTLTIDGATRTVPRFAAGAPPAQAQDLASIQAIGDVYSEVHDFDLFTTAANANLAAQRTLRARSPLAKAHFVTDRALSAALTPGAPFVLEGFSPEIEELVMRVVHVNYGSLDRGEIEVDAVQDVFDTSGVAYADPPEGAEPDPNPLPSLAQRIVEAPYFHVGGERAVYVLAARRGGGYPSYDLWVDEAGAGYAYRAQSSAWAPVGQLEDPYPATTEATDESGFVLVDVQDLDDVPSTDAAGLAAGAVMCMVGDEILSVREIASLGSGRYRVQGVLRGQLDTVPLDHVADTPVYFYRPAGAQRTAEGAYGADLAVAAKVLPTNPGGTVALADATELAITTTSRALKPYPPGNVRLGGLGYDAWPATVAGDAVLTWAHRSRTAQTAMVAQDTAGAYSIEGTLTLEVLIDGVVVPARTVSGVTGTTFTYTWTHRQSDDVDLNKPVAFRITPINGAHTGAVRTTPEFVMEAP